MRTVFLFVAVLIFVSTYALPAESVSVPTSSCVKDTFRGDASTYNPNYAGWKTGGQKLATGGTYNPNEYEAALQLDLAKKHRCGYGSRAICQAIVQTANGKALVVRINDNGPLVPGRVIDLNEKSMRYLSDGKYGRNSGVLRNVTVTLLCDAANTQLGPLDPNDRTAWAQKTFDAPYANVGGSNTPNRGVISSLQNSSVGRFLGIPQQQQAINGVRGGAPQAIPPTLAAPTTSTQGTTSGSSQTSATDTAGNSLLENATNNRQTSAGSNTNNTPPPNTDVLEGKLPTLLCVPGIIEANEPTLLVYGCNDESTSGEGTGFTTNGATSGVAKVHPTETTTYEFACNKGTKAQCVVEVIAPKLSLLATPSKVARGRSVELSWLTEDVQQCIVKSSSHSTFVREGVSLTQGEVVEVQTPSIFQNTTFTLTCETNTGSIHKREVVVEVL